MALEIEVLKRTKSALDCQEGYTDYTSVRPAWELGDNIMVPSILAADRRDVFFWRRLFAPPANFVQLCVCAVCAQGTGSRQPAATS